MGEVELGDESGGLSDDPNRPGEGAVKGSPEDRAEEDKEGVGHRTHVDLDDLLRTQVNPDSGGGERGEEEPEETEEALSIGGAGVAHEKPPAELACRREVPPERKQKLPQGSRPPHRSDDSFRERGGGHVDKLKF